MTPQGMNYRKRNGLPLDDEPYASKQRFFTYNNITLTPKEWAERLEITVHSFNWRLRNYGPDDSRTFLPKEESRRRQIENHFWAGREKGGGRGNAEWKALSNKRR